MAWLSKFINFVSIDIWRMQLRNYSRTKAFLIKQLRIIVLAFRGFAEDNCKFRASALTFFSLLSIVPVIAMMFAIAKGFGLEERVQAEILKRLEGQEKIAEQVIEFANALLKNAKGGFIAGVGVIFLFWAIIKLLGNIENSFNEVWGVKRPRTIGRKFSDYLSMMLVCPILLVVASSMTVVISSQVKHLVEKIPFFSSTIGPLVLMLLKLLPYCSIWIMFTFVFIFMPNTKVKFTSGLLAGIVAGTIFQIAQWAYINFQIGVAKYGAIYGSFAALPLFLLWLQISWLVVLFGAELSFAKQNVETYEFEQDCLRVSHSYKRLLSLLIVHSLVKDFCKGEKPAGAIEISGRLEIPIRLVRQILYELVESGVLSEVKIEENRDVGYHPGRDVEALTAKYVIDALEQRGYTDIPVTPSSELEKLKDTLDKFATAVEESSANVPLKNI